MKRLLNGYGLRSVFSATSGVAGAQNTKKTEDLV